MVKPCLLDCRLLRKPSTQNWELVVISVHVCRQQTADRLANPTMVLSRNAPPGPDSPPHIDDDPGIPTPVHSFILGV